MKRAARSAVLISLLIVFSAPAGAAESARPAPGEYITEGGWGTLKIKPDMKFEIFAMGANGHMCELAGKIVGNRATLRESYADKVCVVRFNVVSGGVTVDSEEGSECRIYCGARAGFEDKYWRPVSGCNSPDIARKRGEFQQFYNAKRYDAAAAKFAPILKNCARTLSSTESGDIRNDLAVTQYHLGDFKGCQKTLEPLTAEAETSDAELAQNYPPVNAEQAIAMAKKTRTNLRLCAKLKK